MSINYFGNNSLFAYARRYDCGEMNPQMASNTENVSIWWRHRDSLGIYSPIISISHLWNIPIFSLGHDDLML